MRAVLGELCAGLLPFLEERLSPRQMAAE